MQTQISSTVALAVAVPFTLGLAASAIAAISGMLDGSSDALQKWDAIKLRNGVKAPSPFHASDSVMNAPGLVEVRPRTERNEPCDRTVPITFPPTPTPTPVPASVPAPVRRDSRSAAHSQASASVQQSERKQSASVNELTKEAILALHARGVSKTKILKQVFGVSPGGSQRYKDARAKYEFIIGEGSNNA